MVSSASKRTTAPRPSRALLFAMTLVSGLALAGCEADLASGVYGCLDDQCPVDWQCRGDDRCYPPDTAPNADFTPCRHNDECGSGLCQKFPDPDQTYGTCAPSPTCTADAACPNGGVCLPNSRCAEACASASECPTNYSCLQVPGPTNKRACIRLDPDPRWESRTLCSVSGPTACTTPVGCFTATGWDALLGICSWPCGPLTDCPGAAECIDLMPPGAIMPMPTCLFPCTSDADCGTGAGTLHCEPRAGTGNGSYCVPPGFSGKY